MSESVRISVFRSNEDIVKKCGKVGCGMAKVGTLPSKYHCSRA